MSTLNSNVTRAISQTAQYIEEKWTREVQQPFDKSLQAAKLVTDRSGLVSDGGDVLNVPFAAGVNARQKVASTAITFDSPDGSPVTLNVDQHYYIGILIEDIAKVQSSYDLKSVFQVRMAEALARQIDTTLMSQYSNAGTTVAGGATVTDPTILSIVAALDTANTPASERRGIIGHNTKTDLLGINKYVAYDQTGKTGKAVDGSEDLTGALYGMDIYHSGNTQADGTNGHNLFFHKSGLTLMKQLAPKYEMIYSVDFIGWKTVLHTIYGTGVERPASLINVTRTTAA